MGEFLAFIAALLFSSQVLLIRWGLSKKGRQKDNTVEETQIIMLFFGILFLLLGIFLARTFANYSLLGDLKELNYYSFFLLIVEGLLGPLSGLYLVTLAIGQIGASRTSALRASNSLFAVILAVLILREAPGIWGFAGVLTISVGIGIVSYRSEKESTSMLPKTKMKGTLIALLSGLSFALSQIARGAALGQGATPTSAIVVSSFSALLFILLYYLIKEKRLKGLRRCFSSKNIMHYAAAGMLTIAGRYALLLSLLYIPVWLAVAIRNTQPLIVLAFSWVFLKKTEIVNFRLVAGTTLIMGGVWVLIFY